MYKLINKNKNVGRISLNFPKAGEYSWDKLTIKYNSKDGEPQSSDEEIVDALILFMNRGIPATAVSKFAKRMGFEEVNFDVLAKEIEEKLGLK